MTLDIIYDLNLINIRIKQTKIQNTTIQFNRLPDFTPNQNY